MAIIAPTEHKIDAMRHTLYYFFVFTFVSVSACDSANDPNGPKATSIEISPGNVLVHGGIAQVGQTTSMSAIAKDSDGSVISSPTIEWTSSNSSVVAFETGSGKIQALTTGQTTLSASINGLTDSIDLMVVNVSGTWQGQLSPTNIVTLEILNNTNELNVTGSFANSGWAIAGTDAGTGPISGRGEWSEISHTIDLGTGCTISGKLIIVFNGTNLSLGDGIENWVPNTCSSTGVLAAPFLIPVFVKI